MNFPAEFSRVERWLLSVALIFIIIIAMKEISFIVTLFLMSLILTLLALPAVDLLKKKGLSNFHATLVVTCLGILIAWDSFSSPCSRSIPWWPAFPSTRTN